MQLQLVATRGAVAGSQKTPFSHPVLHPLLDPNQEAAAGGAGTKGEQGTALTPGSPSGTCQHPPICQGLCSSVHGNCWGQGLLPTD